MTLSVKFTSLILIGLVLAYQLAWELRLRSHPEISSLVLGVAIGFKVFGSGVNNWLDRKASQN